MFQNIIFYKRHHNFICFQSYFIHKKSRPKLERDFLYAIQKTVCRLMSVVLPYPFLFAFTHSNALRRATTHGDKSSCLRPSG